MTLAAVIMEPMFVSVVKLLLAPAMKDASEIHQLLEMFPLLLSVVIMVAVSATAASTWETVMGSATHAAIIPTIRPPKCVDQTAVKTSSQLSCFLYSCQHLGLPTST